MRLRINDKDCVIPSSLEEITLKQRIDFQREHGDLLDEMYKSIMEIEDESEQQLELIQWNLEKMFRTVSFFTGFDIESLRQSEFVDDIFGIYMTTMEQVFEDERQIEQFAEYNFVWNHEEWEIHQPELKNGSKMTFGEFIDSKQIVQDMVNLGKNHWECLVPLCAIYLRKKNEAYKESFLHADSERLQLMESLPLSIALQVGFFLSSSLSMLAKLFPSSTLQESRLEESFSNSTSSASVG